MDQIFKDRAEAPPCLRAGELSLSLSLSVFFSLPLSLPVSLCFSQSLHLSLSLPPSIRFSVSLSLSLSICISPRLSASLSLHLCELHVLTKEESLVHACILFIHDVQPCSECYEPGRFDSHPSRKPCDWAPILKGNSVVSFAPFQRNIC